MMKMPKHITLALLLVAAPPAFSEQNDETLTNADVISLHEAGLAASIIVAKIQGSATDFDTSIDALIGLGNSGVDPAVIEAMTSAGSAAPPPSQPVAPVAVVAGDVSVTQANRASKASNVRTNFEGTPCTTPGIFLRGEEALVDLEVTSPMASKTGSGILSSLTYGIKSAKAKSMIRGSSSPVRTTDQTPSFLFCFEESEVGLSYQSSGAVNPAEFLLLAFDVLPKKRQRSFVTGKMNQWSGSSGGAAPKQMRDSTYTKIAQGVYEVTASLTPGEYAFYYAGEAQVGGFFGSMMSGAGSGKVFAFGVD